MKLLALALAPLAIWAGPAQSGRPSFEVVSIRPARDPHSIITYQISGRRFVWLTTPLIDVIRNAYHVWNWQISGGPAWLAEERYDIEALKPGTAKENVSPFQDEQLRIMLQALLEGRCKLRLHHQIRQGAVFELTVAKGGPKLNPAAVVTDLNQFHGASTGRMPHSASLSGRNASMGDLCFTLSDVFQRPVLDKTGLSGHYDFQAPFARRDDDEGPSLNSALRNQLGLTLTSSRGPVDMIVIDTVERPSAN